MQYARLLATVAAVGIAASAAHAQSQTIATFADPTTGGVPAMFVFNGTSLSGSWTGIGLTLLTPGLAAPDFSDARFSTSVIFATPVIGPPPGFYNTGGGSVSFTDSLNNLLLTITFGSGSLNTAIFAASDFTANNVTFSGPILGGATLSSEAFSFGFANQVGSPTAFTATSSFTSSAVIPAPGAFALVGLGGLAAFRRRR